MVISVFKVRESINLIDTHMRSGVDCVVEVVVRVGVCGSVRQVSGVSQSGRTAVRPPCPVGGGSIICKKKRISCM